jgi:hypothetical protein
MVFMENVAIYKISGLQEVVIEPPVQVRPYDYRLRPQRRGLFR